MKILILATLVFISAELWTIGDMIHAHNKFLGIAPVSGEKKD